MDKKVSLNNSIQNINEVLYDSKLSRKDIKKIKNELNNLEKEINEKGQADKSCIDKIGEIITKAILIPCSIPIIIVISLLTLIFTCTILQLISVSMLVVVFDLKNKKSETEKQIKKYEKNGEHKKVRYLKRIQSKIDDIIYKLDKKRMKDKR